ncbi:SRPBCC family protein [Catenuloplanes sp. NPDC051500]|uniref:SRPBCC family protein n=1 Tax=Catenuloplanes sp. NPDC051500 TaxID=3363959 RepID=UPI00378E256D
MRHAMTVTGPHPADDVWDRYLRPARWPEWAPQIRSVDCDAERIAPGVDGVVHGPPGVRVSFRITAVDPHGPLRSWSWSVTAAGVRMRLHHTVEATPAGTRTGLETHGPAPVVLLYTPVARLALHRLVHGRTGR